MGGYYLPNPNGIKGKEKVKLPWRITMEDYVTIDERCYLQGEITFRQHVAIGNNVHIITEGHNVRSRYFEGTNNPVIIGAGCFIGGDVYIARGVNIGTFSVIGAKSVVWHDVPENSIAYGNPCICRDKRIAIDEYKKWGDVVMRSRAQNGRYNGG